MVVVTIPDTVHELVEYEVACAYANGYADGYARALVDVAERADALDVTWRPIERRTSEQVLAARTASLPPTEGVEAWLSQYAERSRRHDDETVLTGFQYPPADCSRCERGRPYDVMCQCNGIVTSRTQVMARTTR